MLGKNKKIIIAALVIALAFLIFIILRKEKPAEDSLLESTVNSEVASNIAGADAIGAEIIEALNQIEALELDDSIFSDPVFLRLKDKSQPIPPEPKGRENPFAPLSQLIDLNVPPEDTATSTNDIADPNSPSENDTQAFRGSEKVF